MKIIFAADGSKHTKKALAFLVTHEAITEDCELLVLNVQPQVPPRVRAMLDGPTVAGYYKEESDKVLEPIASFLKRHQVTFRCKSAIGHPPEEIVRAAQREQAHLIVMGTHGRGWIGRVVMGSVAQGVVAESRVPVLLIK